MKIKGECSHCGRIVGGRVPKGGDGTGVKLYYHNKEKGRSCEGRHVIVDAIYDETGDQ